MTAIRLVFISGNSQAVRLPKEFRLDTDEVFIRRSGDSLDSHAAHEHVGWIRGGIDRVQR